MDPSDELRSPQFAEPDCRFANHCYRIIGIEKIYLRKDGTMCRNIKPLFNFDPPATAEELTDAALQFIRKISGFHTPSKANEEVFNRGVLEVSEDIRRMLSDLVTDAKPRNRAVEAERAHERAVKRFGASGSRKPHA